MASSDGVCDLTTAMLAVVESVLVRPLAFKDAHQLMIVGVSDSANPGQELSWPNYLSLKHDLSPAAPKVRLST